MKRTIVLTAVLGAVLALLCAGANAQKMTAEEVIAKHLEAIGKNDDRAKMKNITAVGEVAYSKLSQTSQPAVGKVVFAAEDKSSLLAMVFNSTVYTGEKIIFDGKSKLVDFATPGIRSQLGDYLFRYDTIITHNLLGGVLEKGWALTDLQAHGAKVELDGTKKIDGRDNYVLSYQPKKGADVRIKLYFDKETFRHTRTEYLRTNAPGMGHDPNTSSQLVETHENLTEEFSDFQTEYGVTLPRTYKLRLYLERANQTYETQYVITFKEFFYNSKLDPATFQTSE
jgi:outer membrane lipoprotein-sorting protein